MLQRTPRVSVIVPVCNNSRDLEQSLAAVLSSPYPNAELIVVDDGSIDDSALVAARLGARVLHLDRNSGPSSARNLGAREATGDILFFVDADVVVAPDAMERVAGTFESSPNTAAVIGSYDENPRAKGLVSEYRNLLHHFVHQHGEPAASTFWSACGAIRRSVFEEVGGFDEQRFPRCIEDIELGYRLRRAGHDILLDKGLQGTHLKRWTLRSMIRTDVCCRAIPWTRLILETKSAPDDLNLRDGQRASVGLLGIAILSLFGALFRPEALVAAVLALLLVLMLNRALYVFLAQRRGWLFAAGSACLHLLYFVYGGLAYLYVWCDCRLWRGEHSLTLSQGIKPLGPSSTSRTATPL
jgi:GT2 family glycosyltransferase